MVAKPVAEIADIVVGYYCDAARVHRCPPIGRRQPHQDLQRVDGLCGCNAEAMTVEQLCESNKTEMVQPTQRRPVNRSGQVGRAIAQDHVAVGRPQMLEERFRVGDVFQNAEHCDDVGFGRGLGWELSLVEVANDCLNIPHDQIATLIIACRTAGNAAKTFSRIRDRARVRRPG